MCFVEKEDQLGFFRIADLGKIFERFREHPEQKCRVNFWRLLHQAVRGKNVDRAFAVLCLNEVIKVERGLAEKLVGPL